MLASAVISIVQICNVKDGIRFQDSQRIVVSSVTVYHAAITISRVGGRREVEDAQGEFFCAQAIPQVDESFHKTTVMTCKAEGGVVISYFYGDERRNFAIKLRFVGV